MWPFIVITGLFLAMPGQLRAAAIYSGTLDANLSWASLLDSPEGLEISFPDFSSDPSTHYAGPGTFSEIERISQQGVTSVVDAFITPTGRGFSIHSSIQLISMGATMQSTSGDLGTSFGGQVTLHNISNAPISFGFDWGYSGNSTQTGMIFTTP